jgi:hypothetical protein
MAVDGRQYAFTHLVGKLPLTTPMSATWNVHGTGALGHKPPITCVACRTFMRRLRPAIGHPIVKDKRSFIGLSGHSDIIGSTLVE